MSDATTTADAGTRRPGLGPSPRDTGRARAYCGPAHGRQWTGDRDEPPARVELPVGPSTWVYRLVRQRRSGRPARDELGNLLYVPITGDAAGVLGSAVGRRTVGSAPA